MDNVYIWRKFNRHVLDNVLFGVYGLCFMVIC